jgi:hypothetical protein
MIRVARPLQLEIFRFQFRYLLFAWIFIRSVFEKLHASTWMQQPLEDFSGTRLENSVDGGFGERFCLEYHVKWRERPDEIADACVPVYQNHVFPPAQSISNRTETNDNS